MQWLTFKKMKVNFKNVLLNWIKATVIWNVFLIICFFFILHNLLRLGLNFRKLKKNCLGKFFYSFNKPYD